ncbi:Eukaryotic translation initiation factor 5A-1 [Ananas comosus]|uniref:Eukaryotic translation initiation factor 5A-1 n=1 Tax=Ananas comosus TaxID=4615 RepID=A0A199VE48_ANACO|nr:Eukaryotic translation initiation factor 5A-1 [Ananas comosus]
MGYRLCLSFSDEYQGEPPEGRQKIERDRKFAAWVGGSDSAVVEILDRSEISHPFSSNPIQVSYRYAAGRKTALLVERHASCLASSHLLHSRETLFILLCVKVSLLTENGNTKDDLRLPTDESLLMQIVESREKVEDND